MAPKVLKFVVIFSLAVSSAAAAEDWKFFVWSKQDEAAYYRGTIFLNDKEFRFRTSQTRILAPAMASISDIKAISAGSVLIKQIDSKNVSTTQTSGTISPEDHDPAFEKWVSEVDKEYDLVIEEEKETPSPEPPIAKTYWDGTLELQVRKGLGKESLTVDGGVSEFSSSPNISTTELWIAARPHFENTTKHFYSLLYSTHNFTTQIDEETETLGVTSEKTISLRRVLADLSFYYHTITNQQFGELYLKGGYGINRFPILEIADTSTGKSKFTEVQVNGFHVGLYLDTQYDQKSKLASSFTYRFGSGPAKLQNTIWEFTWKYRFFDPLSSVLGINFTQGKADTKFDCANISGCSTSTSSKWTLYKLLFGIEGQIGQ